MCLPTVVEELTIGEKSGTWAIPIGVSGDDDHVGLGVVLESVDTLRRVAAFRSSLLTSPGQRQVVGAADYLFALSSSSVTGA